MPSHPVHPADQARAAAYTSVASEVEHTLEIQRSVFLTRLVPVGTEEAARAVIEEQRRAHRDARHHCSAMVLGPDRDIQRSSDDGEPGGTAGVPMMQALLQRETAPGVRDLSDVVAVTTRWFGGILLGAGGLVRAYSDSVSQALSHATPLTWIRRRELVAAVPIAEAGRAGHALRGLGPAVTSTRYTPDAVEITLAVDDAEDALVAVTDRIARALGGRVTTHRGRAVWAR